MLFRVSRSKFEPVHTSKRAPNDFDSSAMVKDLKLERSGAPADSRAVKCGTIESLSPLGG